MKSTMRTRTSLLLLFLLRRFLLLDDATRLVLIDKAIPGEPLDDIMFSFLLFFLLLTFSFSPTIFSMYAVDSFDSTPPLATFAPRLARGLGVLEFPEFLFLVIGSLLEHRGTAGSSAHTRPPIGGVVRTPQSRGRAGEASVLRNFSSYHTSALCAGCFVSYAQGRELPSRGRLAPLRPVSPLLVRPAATRTV